MRLYRLLYQQVTWRGISMLSVFVLNVLLARVLGPEQSGALFYTIYLFSLVLVVGGLSLESGMTYGVSRGSIHERGLIRFILIWVLGITPLLLMFFYILWKLLGFSLWKENWMLPAFFYLAGNLLITYATGIWQAKSRFRTANAWMTGCNLLLIAFIFSGFPQWADSRWKEMLIFIYFLAFLAQGLALIIHLRYQISGPDETFFPKKDELRKLFSYSLVALLANLLFFIAYRVDYVFVARFCSGADLGQYIQVSRIGQLLVTVPSLAATVLFPLAGSDEKLRRPEHITALSRLVFFFSAGCNLIGVLTGWWLFPSLLGKGFEDVYPVYLVLIPGILALSILYPLVAYYSAREMIPVNIRALLVAIVVILTGDFLLIRKFGIYAAASISSLGYICYMVYMMSHFKKMTGTAVHVFFRFRKSDIDAMLILVRQKIK